MFMMVTDLHQKAWYHLSEIPLSVSSGDKSYGDI